MKKLLLVLGLLPFCLAATAPARGEHGHHHRPSHPPRHSYREHHRPWQWHRGDRWWYSPWWYRPGCGYYRPFPVYPVVCAGQPIYYYPWWNPEPWCR